MIPTARQGKQHRCPVDGPRGGRPRRWWLAAMLMACAVAPVSAGTLYRCSGSGGEVVFTGSRAGYRDCKVLSTYREPAARRASTAPRDGAAPRGAAPRPSFAGVVGAAITTPLLPPAAAVPTAAVPLARRGQWSYQDSSAAASASSSVAPAVAEAKALASVQAAPAADRVLRGAVYRVVRKDGSVEYTNIAPAGDGRGRAVTMLFTYIATCVACNLRSPINWNTVALDLTSYAAAIESASVEYGVDPALLRAVIHAESAFNPRALSIKGAQGLMQLMPGTAGDMGVRDAFDAAQNIRGGARYLALLLADLHGDERLAAAAYNAGEGAVRRYGGVPPYAETQVYVERVGTLRRRYREATDPSRGAGGNG